MRDRRTVPLTAAGETLLLAAVSVLRAWEAAPVDVAEATTTLAIGASALPESSAFALGPVGAGP